MNREEILKMAMELTLGERNKAYGDPVENHRNIAAFMNAYMQTRMQSLGEFEGPHLDAEDAMALMLCVKLARIAQRRGDQTDTYIDLTAYAAMMGEAAASRYGARTPFADHTEAEDNVTEKPPYREGDLKAQRVFPL